MAPEPFRPLSKFRATVASDDQSAESPAPSGMKFGMEAIAQAQHCKKGCCNMDVEDNELVLDDPLKDTIKSIEASSTSTTSNPTANASPVKPKSRSGQKIIDRVANRIKLQNQMMALSEEQRTQQLLAQQDMFKVSMQAMNKVLNTMMKQRAADKKELRDVKRKLDQLLSQDTTDSEPPMRNHKGKGSARDEGPAEQQHTQAVTDMDDELPFKKCKYGCHDSRSESARRSHREAVEEARETAARRMLEEEQHTTVERGSKPFTVDSMLDTPEDDHPAREPSE